MARVYKSRKRKNKSAMPFEKKVMFQSIASITILAYCLVVSGTNSYVSQKEFINRTVNITSTKRDMKNALFRSKEISKKAMAYGGNILDSIVYFCNNGFGKTESENLQTALASDVKTEYEDVQAEKPAENPHEEPILPKEEKHIFRMPSTGRITSEFGERTHPVTSEENIHYGIDIAGNHGDCVISALPGTVVATGNDKALGNYVKIRHNDSMETVYGHLSEILVRKDEVVDHNTRIGSIGSTGVATGPHLHLEVRINGKSVDPKDYIGKKI